jgi:alanyl-tRNA synthetase
MHSLAPAEPYTRSFEASVTSVEGTEVTLEETYFYAEGGGQPADRGQLGGATVLDVQSRDGEVVHRLATEPAFAAGDTVEASVDPAFRSYCMRAHTASHVLYGAGRQLLDDLGYGGFDISAPESEEPSADGKVRVDFTTPTDIDDETLVDLERLTNRAVWDSRSVTWERVPQEAALNRPDIAFNTKTEEGLSGDTVRVVTVEGWDVAACGGTHVGNTREIGPVTLLDRSNPGEGLTRVEFAVGYRAIEARAATRRHATAAAATLQTGVPELPEAVSRLRSENQELHDERDALAERLVDTRLAELRETVVQKEGSAWLVGTVPGLGANELAARAQRVVGEGADVVALLDEDGGYLAVATSGDVDAGGVVEEVTAEFGGGGGGSQTVAQGGGLGADAESIVAFLRE